MPGGVPLADVELETYDKPTLKVSGAKRDLHASRTALDDEKECLCELRSLQSPSQVDSDEVDVWGKTDGHFNPALDDVAERRQG